MATNTATVLIATAGTITFANEWYQTKKLNWRVPVATVLAAIVFDGIAHLDSTAATSLAAIAFLTAMTTEFNGKSAAATVAATFPTKATTNKVTVVLWTLLRHLSQESCLLAWLLRLACTLRALLM